MSECAPSGSVPAGSCHVASHSCVHTLAFVDLEPQPYLTFYISLASSLQCLGTLAPPVPNPVYSMLHLAQNLTVRWELPLGGVVQQWSGLCSSREVTEAFLSSPHGGSARRPGPREPMAIRPWVGRVCLQGLVGSHPLRVFRMCCPLSVSAFVHTSVGWASVRMSYTPRM